MDLPNTGMRAELTAQLLQAAFDGSRHYRRDRADRYPDDTRNAEAVTIFDRLLSTLGKCELPDLARLGDINVFEATDQPSAEMQDMLREIGFTYSPADASEFVRDYIAKFAAKAA